MHRLVLAHSPLTGPAVWGALPDVLRSGGHEVAVLDVRDDDEPPYAARYVARAATQLSSAVPAGPVTLVAHSGAGYLLPQLGAARRAARATVGGYVFVDAGIPHARGATRLSLLRAEDPEAADSLHTLLDAGQDYPPWTDDDLRHLVPHAASRAALVASLRPRGRDFFTEEFPFPGDWPDAPCGYLQLSPAYDRPARLAAARGWPVVRADPPGGHFATLVDPAAVAEGLGQVLDLM